MLLCEAQMIGNTNWQITYISRSEQIYMSHTAIRELLGEQLGPDIGNRDISDQTLLELLNPPAEVAATRNSIKVKERLEKSGIAVPDTLEQVHQQDVINTVIRMLIAKGTPFVVKPVHANSGRGVLPCLYADESGVTKLSGESLSLDTLNFHFYQILHGEFSAAGKPDSVLVEEYLQTGRQWVFPNNPGAPTLRLILCMDKVVAAEVRLPTLASNGRNNLSCGAVRVPVNLQTALTLNGYMHGKPVLQHPDTGVALADNAVENLPAAINLALRCRDVFNLGFMAIDIIEDVMETPVILGVEAGPQLRSV